MSFLIDKVFVFVSQHASDVSARRRIRKLEASGLTCRCYKKNGKRTFWKESGVPEQGISGRTTRKHTGGAPTSNASSTQSKKFYQKKQCSRRLILHGSGYLGPGAVTHPVAMTRNQQRQGKVVPAS